MPKKRVDLKKRLDELRNEPEAAVNVSINLEAAVFRALSVMAQQQQLSLEHYIQHVLQRHVDE